MSSVILTKNNNNDTIDRRTEERGEECTQDEREITQRIQRQNTNENVYLHHHNRVY